MLDHIRSGYAVMRSQASNARDVVIGAVTNAKELHV